MIHFEALANGFGVIVGAAGSLAAEETGDMRTPTVIASTASAYKFAESVASACGIGPCRDGFEYVAALAAATGIQVPYGLRDLDKKPVLHKGIVDADKMKDAVREALK